MSTISASDNLYLVLSSDELDVPEGEEYFTRAIVYAGSAQDAIDKVCSYIDFCNEAEDAEDAPEADLTKDLIEEFATIYYDKESMQTTLLAGNAQRPDEEMFDAEDILVFDTEWWDTEV